MTKFAHDTIVPNAESDLSKKEQVAEMFDDIAGKYDFLNRLLSAGIDVRWRKKALALLKPIAPKTLLDVATGTGDVAIMAADLLNPDKIVGIDISEGMLQVGREKIAKAGLQSKIELQKGDSETINFANFSFDAVTVAFGVRNFQDLEKGLAEIFRVLRPGGKLVVLEFSRPHNVVMKGVYDMYMKAVTPSVGQLVSKNRDAYAYLDESIRKFPEGDDFVKIMAGIGFKNILNKRMTFGICSIYSGEK